MNNIDTQQLLRNKKVLEEISRHQWIESEKAGFDIGFDKASEEWLVNFSKEWMEYHLPKQKTVASKPKTAAKGSGVKGRSTSAKKKTATSTKAKKSA